jgi:hypothetical protein
MEEIDARDGVAVRLVEVEAAVKPALDLTGAFRPYGKEQFNPTVVREGERLRRDPWRRSWEGA